MFSTAFLRSDVRLLIRNIVRVGATQHNAKLAARFSLLSSLETFPKRYQPVLMELNIEEDFKNILNANDEEISILRSQLKRKFDRLFSNPLNTKSNDVLNWIDCQFQGLPFQDLIEKYMEQGLIFSDSLKRVSDSASKDNPTATKNMANQKPTHVTEKYKRDMVESDLFKPAFTSSSVLRYKVVDLQKEL